MNEAGDNPRGADTTCDAVLCGADEHVQSNTCTTCPALSFNEAGDDPTGDDTTCETDACLAALGSRCEEVREAYIKASNTGLFDGFGKSVALSADGSTLAVGASGERSSATGVDGDQSDNSAIFSGAVYIFTRTGSGWSQQAYLKASNAGASDGFGHSVALSADGSTLAVAAPREDSDARGVDGDQENDDAFDSGAAYVFTRQDGSWSQQTYVKGYNTRVNIIRLGALVVVAGFGAHLALSADGKTLAISGLEDDGGAAGVKREPVNDDVTTARGVYMFTREGTSWSRQAFVNTPSSFLRVCVLHLRTDKNRVKLAGEWIIAEAGRLAELIVKKQSRERAKDA